MLAAWGPLGVRAMARQAQSVGRFARIGGLSGAVRIVATETRDAARIHEALNEIVALHAILVSGAVSKMREGCSPELVLLEPPEILEIQSD